MDRPIDWQIHLVSNGANCDICGKTEDSFHKYLCNAHTHGIERYNHKNFQLVLDLPDAEICRILNTLGIMVRDGRKFNSGELVKGIYEDCDVRLDEFVEDNRTVLRVIIPDKNNLFPESAKCMYPYSAQKLGTEYLCQKGRV